MSIVSLRLDNIQGNIFGGFNKDFQSFIFMTFTSAAAGRAWIGEITDAAFGPGVAGSSSADVLKFNGAFKALKAQGLRPEDFLAIGWTNLALTHRGLVALGLKAGDLTTFPSAFQQGMAARKGIIGDVGGSTPAGWIAPFDQPADIHAVLIVAAENEAMLADRVAAIEAGPAFAAGVVKLAPTVEGRVRLGAQSGHEHFGFKDGVSQPGIIGVTRPDDPLGNPRQGQPGQDLLWPGEFVLGYPTQIPHAAAGVDGPNPHAGPKSTSGPHWTVDGSYLVFRQLGQNVPAFDQQIADLAASTGLAPDLVGAKIVGRYKSGCPLETRAFAPPGPVSATDPGLVHPALADSDSLNVAFEFGDDADGAICPLSAHIRKAYPRDEQALPNNVDSESDTQTHRLLRRGIPFGGSIGDPTGGKLADLRGLLFLCYQKSIEHQFEFVQSQWVNDPNFPPFPAGRPRPGQDPLIAQSNDDAFQLDATHGAITLQHFVTTLGGDYFFAPSIKALQEIGAGLH